MACPDEKTLELLVRGQLSDADAELLARHLEECDQCAATIHALPADDTLIAAARAQAPPQSPFEQQAVEALIGRLSGLSTALHVRATDSSGGGTADSPGAAIAAVLTPPQAPDELGRLGHYRVLGVLGAGGM